MQDTSQVDLSRVHALVLDDHQNFVSIMRSILRGFGIRHIIEATDPLRAVEMVQHQPIDIAFIDLKMPLINGLEFTRLVRNSSDSPNRRLPIVLVTGNALRSTITDAINAGIEEVLAKPLCPKNVYLRMMRLLQEPYEYVEFPGYFGPCRRRSVDHMYAGPERREDDSELAPVADRPRADKATAKGPERRGEPAPDAPTPERSPEAEPRSKAREPDRKSPTGAPDLQDGVFNLDEKDFFLID